MTLLLDEEPTHLLCWVQQGHDLPAMVKYYFPGSGVEGGCCRECWYIFYSGEPCNTHAIDLEFNKMLRENDFWRTTILIRQEEPRRARVAGQTLTRKEDPLVLPTYMPPVAVPTLTAMLNG
jgi:hypothetical protein